MVNTHSQRAFIFDLDGTAIPSRIDGMPSAKLKRAITEKSSVGYFCAATGRSWLHAKAPILDLKLTAPCVISGGTQIIDPITEKIIWEMVIPPQSVKMIQAIARKYDKSMAYVAGLDVTDPLPPTDSITASRVNTMYMFNITPEQLSEVIAEIHEIGNVNAALTRSWLHPGITDLHITHINATKEYAIAELCQRLGVGKESAVGIGDGHNDIHLFNAVGTKIAMGNAEEALKKVADQIVDSLEDDGLATFISNLRKEDNGLSRQDTYAQ